MTATQIQPETDQPLDSPAGSALDMARLQEFMGGVIGDVGATISAGLVVIGDRLGLYASLAAGAATADELASRTGTSASYIAPWLANQAASGYVSYDSGSQRYSMTAEQSFALAAPDGLTVPGSFQLALGVLRSLPDLERRFRDGSGFGWHEHDSDVFNGTERFFRPGYVADLIATWLPALDGVVEKLEAGASVVDVGCGHGASTVLMAQAFPASTFLGTDYHEGSIQVARRRAREAGVSGRVIFEAHDARDLPAGRFDLVTMFDCLHDMGDPVGAARAACESLLPGGTLLLVEPNASDRIEENFNPIGRIFYGASALICTPSALDQEGDHPLSTQSGPARLTAVLTAAGFSSVRIAAQSPLNLVLEARR